MGCSATAKYAKKDYLNRHGAKNAKIDEAKDSHESAFTIMLLGALGVLAVQH